MIRTVTIKDAAKSDLDALYDYTDERWGRAQARVYFEALGQTLQLLSGNPDIGREWTGLSPPARLHRFRSHMVIYRANDASLDVLRIVHARSNWQALLSD